MNRGDIEKRAQESLPTFGITFDPYYAQLIRDGYHDGFIAGAEWMQEQYEQNRLKHSENLTKEEYDREVAFSEWFYSQGFYRQPTFSDAIEWGRKQIQDEIKNSLKKRLNSLKQMKGE